MNLRCFYCQTPFTLGRAEILAGLQRMDAENMNHYDAHCPRCRRANSIARQRMEMFMPNWREELARQEAAPSLATEQGPASAPIAVMPPADLAPAKPRKPARKRAGSAKKTAEKPAAKAKKPAAKSKAGSTKSSEKKKTTTKSRK